MIGYLRGVVDQLLVESCYLDVRGVGYRIFVPASTRANLTVGSETKLFTFLNVREDALHLFGFLTLEEHEMFLLLITVSGVGPKLALSILSGMKPEGIRSAVSRNDLASLTRISGVGKKTAERIVLELKDKIGQLSAPVTAFSATGPSRSEATSAFDEALAALTSLGYQQSEVLPYLQKLKQEGKSTQDLIRAVLLQLGGR